MEKGGKPMQCPCQSRIRPVSCQSTPYHLYFDMAYRDLLLVKVLLLLGASVVVSFLAPSVVFGTLASLAPDCELFASSFCDSRKEKKKSVRNFPEGAAENCNNGDSVHLSCSAFTLTKKKKGSNLQQRTAQHTHYFYSKGGFFFPSSL